MKYIIKLSFSILIILLVTIFQFCRKEEIKKIIKVTTGEISGITTNSASAKGDIVDVIGGTLQYGHCWSTSQKPTYDNEKTILYTEEIPGIFTSSLTGLSPGTTYYIRAFAYEVNDKNGDGINDGIIAYGNEKNFKTEDQTLATIITGSVNEITPNTAKITSILSNPGSGVDSVLQHGHCWSTSQEPTISNNKTELGSRNSTGEFTSDITGLQKDTKYYVRAYATSEVGTAYGNEISFTTYSRVPSITTISTSSITGNSAESGGNITDDGGSAITARGVCWNTSQNPTILDNITLDDSGIGSFKSSITGLSIGTVYYVRAYVTTSICTAYGNEISFSTRQTIVSPTVTTSFASDITETSATLGGNVTSDGGATVTERGVYYSTSASPEATGTKLSIGSGTGTYSTSLTGFSAGTTYYIKAYAINSQGEALGSEVSFTTNSGSGNETGTVTDYDGNTYNTVKIGDQWWMAENLKVTKYSDGTAVPLVENNIAWVNLIETDKAYCYYNNDSSTHAETYGALYTWAAASGNISSSSNPSGVQGICPTGWHLPSDDEWKELEMFLGMSQAEANVEGSDRGTDEGGKLKETGTTHWNSPNTGATNISGFSALPGGYRYYLDGIFGDLGMGTSFWTSTDGTWYHHVNSASSKVGRDPGTKKFGYSVRCLRDF